MSWMSLLLIQAVATLAMTGLIWFVQLVHYPLLRRVGAADFRRYAAEHQRRTSWLVVPLMLAEAGAAAALAVADRGLGDRWLTSLGIVLLAMAWFSTFLLQVPLHRRLVRGWDPAAARRLVHTNWIRTAAWSGRAAVALALIDRAAGGLG